MKELIFLFLFLLNSITILKAQLRNNWEIKTGVNIASQRLTAHNQEHQTSPVLGWQIGLTKILPIAKVFDWEISGGFTQAGVQSPDLSFVEEVAISYWFLETGGRVENTFGNIRPFAGIAIRGSKVYQGNVEKALPFLLVENYDYGLNFKVGVGYEKWKVKPFVEVAYYLGLPNIANPSSFYSIDGYTNTKELFTNEMKNYFWGIQSGIRF